MPRSKCLFSFYGSKSKIAHNYPEPRYNRVIEPFAGGGTYSLNQALDRNVWLNDLHPQVYRVWRWLIETPKNEILEAVPDDVEKGERFEGDDVASLFCRANCNMGTFGTDGEQRQVTSFAATNWHQVTNRVDAFADRINHWKVTNWDYRDLPNPEATWFVDPPYISDAGDRYRYSEIDFEHLAEWCRSRNGQVIVCENSEADWLPFEPLVKAHTRGGVKSETELIWTS